MNLCFAVGRKASAAFGMLLLAACAADTSAPLTGVAAPELGTLHIRWIESPPVIRIDKTYAEENVEYVQYRSGDLRAEATRILTMPLQWHLHHPYRNVERAIDGWKFNQGWQPGLGGTVTVRLDKFDDLTIQYLNYALPAQGLACVGFLGEWEIPVGEPLDFPRNLVFGYACDRQGGSINDDTARQLVASIAVNEPGHAYAKPATEPQIKSTQIANADFPFIWAFPTEEDVEGDSERD